MYNNSPELFFLTFKIIKYKQMKLKVTILFLLITNFIYADGISDYMNKYKSSGKTDYKKEQELIKQYSYQKLVNELSPFFSDSVTAVKRKAYYLTYKKGFTSSPKIKQKAVLKLLTGCDDKNGGLVGQLFSYLLQFPAESFEKDAKDKIDKLLNKRRIYHFKKLVMLAGIAGAGQETMQKKLLKSDIKNKDKWVLSLALSRQGIDKYTNYCIKQVSTVPVNNKFVSYIVPDLIYTRQAKAIKYCVDIIYSNKKDCYSPNPDKPENILCAYRIMELLAPVIIDFPFKTDATGSLDTEDYENALKIVRTWFTEEPKFQIRK